MDSRVNVNDFEVTIHDSSGIRGIKNGKEYLISKGDWDKANPKHRDVGCKECIFADNKDTILVYFVSRELKEKATEEPTFIGKFNMSGWTGHSSFYIFKCKDCDKLQVDYPHGYTSDGFVDGLLYLYCDNCKDRIVLYKKEIYRNEGMKPPPTVLEMLFGVIKLSWRMKREQP